MVNLYNIKIKNVEIPVKLNSNKNFKNFKISFNVTKGYMNVSKPSFMKMSEVNRYIKDNEKLIYDGYIEMLEKRKEFDLKKSTFERKWVTGEKMLLLGNEYEIIVNEIDKNIVSIDFKDGKIVIEIPFGTAEFDRNVNILKVIKMMLKSETEKAINTRLPYLSTKTKIKYSSVKIKYAKSLWGSCVKNTKSLNFSSRIAMLPIEVIDAIIIHELCHIVHGNHSKSFWELVYKFCPDYKKCDEWIKQNMAKFEIE